MIQRTDGQHKRENKFDLACDRTRIKASHPLDENSFSETARPKSFPTRRFWQCLIRPGRLRDILRASGAPI